MWNFFRKHDDLLNRAARFEMTPLERRVLFAVAAPSALSAAATVASSSDIRPQISLNWQDNSTNETGFELFRALQGGTLWKVATSGANATSFVDTNVSGGQTYNYQIRAMSGIEVSGFSNTAVATTAPETVPLAPSNLSGVLQATTLSKRGGKATRTLSAVITWQDNANNESRYVLEISADGVNWVYLTLSPNSTSYTDSAISSGATYYYRVAAYNSAGTSAWSNVFMLKT